MPTDHPCGALPVHGWNLSLWWCVHHQAYWATAMSYVQNDDEDLLVTHGRSLSFGPFDTLADVERWLQGQWLEMKPRTPST